jgi:hypothetical protein
MSLLLIDVANDLAVRLAVDANVNDNDAWCSEIS